MSDEAYPLQETGRDEEFLFFSGNTEDQACVGHLRGDFGSGTEFWTTWWGHNEELNVREFKDELGVMVDALRKDGPLKNLSSMERFCWNHPKARMSPESGTDYYGFRVDTASHRYYLRFLPLRGNYNFYIYCYQTDKFERMADLPSREGSESSRTIKVLVMEPMKPCEVREISGDLESLREIIGGDIEMASPFTEPMSIICRAKGENLNLPPNRLLCDSKGSAYDILYGTFLIAGIDGENFVPLTDSQIHCCKMLFDHRRMYAIPLKVPDSQEKRPEHNKKKKGESLER